MSKDFNLYHFGGTGINILNRYLSEGKNSRFIDQVVALDTSEANPVVDGMYPLERLEGVEGSGGDRRAHADKYADFVKQVFAKYKPNKINILTYSLSGGTGASMGPYALRYLLQKKIPVLVICIGDKSTFNEEKNTVEALGSMYNQIKTGSPVLFNYIENSATVSQGQVNQRAVGEIDNALMMFNMENERIDYADIKNFFFFTDVTQADPIMSQVTFLAEGDIGRYDRKPVAAISLYNNIDEIRAPFENMLYRKSGLFGESFSGMSVPVHAVLDHGDTIQSLKTLIENKETKNNELAGQFRNKEVDLFGSSDDDGMM
ncbi:tubulin-like protein [Serratia phage vB_SmaM-Yubaba]|nr:tubulin-like protein [Serratia phage vB_SmaM-Sureiya]UQT03414.1 tubulin-like protein [Serratia phage vB_SmaM-Yubaba]